VKNSKVLSFFLLSIAVGVSVSHAIPPAEREQYRDWDGIYKFTHDDKHSFKAGKPYVVDQYIWSYTKAFAEKFRMPSEGVSEELKGAEAVAWRMTTIGDVSCGFGNNPQSCIQPLTCQLDVYYDNKILLPWTRPEIIRDNIRGGLDSSRFLGLIPGDSRRRYVPGNVMDSGGVLSLEKNFPMGGDNVASYDKEFQKGLGLITYVGGGVCPTFSEPKKVYMTYWTYEDPKGEKRKEVHVIELPRDFIARLKPVYDEKNESNSRWKDKFFDKASGPSQ